MKIENVKIYDLEESTKASKYPMAVDTDSCSTEIVERTIRLAKSPKGEAHDQFLTGIRVNFDLTISNKAWVEAERYRFLEFVSSQSTMHKITKLDIRKQCNKYVWESTISKLEEKVREYNELFKTEIQGDMEFTIKHRKQMNELYLEILYNVPAGFELTARMATNYRCLKSIYSQRRNHRLPDWQMICDWIETLPYAKELIIDEKKSS